MITILLSAKAGSGKSTVADHIRKHINNIQGLDATVVPNADGVRAVLYNVFNWDGVKDDKGRELLVNMTDIGYTYDKYFWERKTLKNYTILKGVKTDLVEDFLIIDDYRYETTKEFFSMYSKVVVVSLERDNVAVTYDKSIVKDSEELHLSIVPDYILDGNCELRELDKRTKELVDVIIEDYVLRD